MLSPQSEAYCFLLTLFISLLSIYYSQKGYNHGIALCFLRAGFMLPYFQLGFLYQKFEKYLRKNAAAAIGIMIATMYVLYAIAGSEGLGAQAVFCRFTGNPLLITLLTILSILITATIADVLSPAFEHSKIIHTIGNHTFTIMMHHGFVIFLINLAIYILNFFTDISTFKVEQFQSTLWYACPWIDSRIYLLYLVVSIALPLACKLLSNQMIIWQYDALCSHKKEFPCRNDR